MRSYLLSHLEPLLPHRGQGVLCSAALSSLLCVPSGVYGAVYGLVYGLMAGVTFLTFRRVAPLILRHAFTSAIYYLHLARLIE